jgi:hypothetical protein
VEDPRVTLVEGEFIITYSAYSRNGVRIALAKTRDFRQVERVSLITEEGGVRTTSASSLAGKHGLSIGRGLDFCQPALSWQDSKRLLGEDV